MNEASNLIAFLGYVGHAWSFAIVAIYLFNAIQFIKLYSRLTKKYKWQMLFIICVCILMALAFIINTVVTLLHMEITVSTLYVITVIRPLIFLSGIALCIIANTILSEFKARGG